MDVVFWINAFIPKTVAGYTQVLPGGAQHSGKTAVPLPGVANLNPLNWAMASVGFLTDQRGFSNLISASVRMQCSASIDPATGKMLQNHRSSGTTEVDMKTGAQRAFAFAKMTRCNFGTVSKRTLGPKTFYDTKLKAAAGDPLVSAAADIDYNGTLTVEVDTASGRALGCSFTGKIDAFPAYEAYAIYHNRTHTLFTNSPPKGNTVTNLLGGANRTISGSVRF
ncbi:MAG: hypothetical protein AAF601_00030 [Pseudomonadota bacterium]